MSLIEQEPLLRKRKERPSIIPINPEFQREWELYKQAESSFWTAEELDLEEDPKHWDKLSSDEKLFIENILGFFSGADGIVNENLAENFSRQIDIPEIKSFYGFQIAMENIHNEVYGLLIERLVQDPVRRNQLAHAIHHLPNISKMYDWAKRWIQLTPEQELATNPKLDPEDPQDRERAEIWTFAKRLVAFACVEGIMFSGPFCAIFWLKEKGILPGLTFSNELISRDEGLHTVFACQLYSRIVNKPPQEEILQIVQEAVEFEQEFVQSCLKQLTGINADTMNQYIEYVADNLLNRLGYAKRWKTKLPPTMKFMEKISFDGMTNFFEKKVAEYSLGGFESGEHSKDDLLTDDF